MCRLITHNMLASNVKVRSCLAHQPRCVLACAAPELRRAQDVANGYPLRIEAQKLETREVEFNAGACCCAALAP